MRVREFFRGLLRNFWCFLEKFCEVLLLSNDSFITASGQHDYWTAIT